MTLGKILLLALTGGVGGVLGGMGMGGGTLLIPALTWLFGVEQKIAQSINLIAFLPMSAIALAIHIKNKRVDFKEVVFMIIPAVLCSVGGSLLTYRLSGKILKKAFGVFLAILGVFNVIFTKKSISKK